MFFRNDDNGNGERQQQTTIDEIHSYVLSLLCCHCEPVRVWQSMENKKTTTKRQKRLDCHKNTSCFFAMTTTAKANGNGKRQWMKYIPMCCHCCAVTANPLGCDSLWKIKKQQQRKRRWIATTFGHGMTKKSGKRIYFAMDCHGNKLPRNDDNDNGNGKGNDKRQTTKGNKKMTRIVILAIFLFFTSFL